jgi:putative redox protein
MTIGMYARRRGWPLDGVMVRLRHSKIHAQDCQSCETKEGKLDLIDSEIQLTGALSAEQKSKLLEIAEKCPVHKTLVSEISIRTRLV